MAADGIVCTRFVLFWQMFFCSALAPFDRQFVLSALDVASHPFDVAR
jgi:hypothetical protein